MVDGQCQKNGEKKDALHATNIVSNFFWFPEFSVAVYTWFVDVVMIIIFSIGFNFEQMVLISLVLFPVMLAHDVEFRSIIVDTFLSWRSAFQESNWVVRCGDIVHWSMS